MQPEGYAAPEPMKDFIEILKIVTWPLIVLILAVCFRGVIKSLVLGSKIKLKLAGVEIETTLREFATVIQETYRHGRLTDEQWEWLGRLKREGRIPYDQAQYLVLRPLRNSGLIHEHPEGTLTGCESVSITPLGALLLKNRGS